MPHIIDSNVIVYPRFKEFLLQKIQNEGVLLDRKNVRQIQNYWLDIMINLDLENKTFKLFSTLINSLEIILESPIDIAENCAYRLDIF